MAYSDPTAKQYAGSSDRAMPSAVPKERAIDSLKSQIRALAEIAQENGQRIEQIANRLGYCPPKSDEATKCAPVPNGHLEGLSDMIRDLHNGQQSATEYLNAIERQV